MTGLPRTLPIDRSWIKSREEEEQRERERVGWWWQQDCDPVTTMWSMMDNPSEKDEMTILFLQPRSLLTSNKCMKEGRLHHWSFFIEASSLKKRAEQLGTRMIWSRILISWRNFASLKTFRHETVDNWKTPLWHDLSQQTNHLLSKESRTKAWKLTWCELSWFVFPSGGGVCANIILEDRSSNKEHARHESRCLLRKGKIRSNEFHHTFTTHSFSPRQCCYPSLSLKLKLKGPICLLPC